MLAGVKLAIDGSFFLFSQGAKQKTKTNSLIHTNVEESNIPQFSFLTFSFIRSTSVKQRRHALVEIQSVPSEPAEFQSVYAQ